MPYIYKELTERHRPHFHPPGATLFLMFRLANSIPKATLRLYQAEKDWLDAEAERLRKLRLKDDSIDCSQDRSQPVVVLPQPSRRRYRWAERR